MLRLDKVNCGYGKNFSLKNISFFLPEKEITGIIGPNGAGKTTLLRTITKLLPLNKGNINFCGKDIDQISLQDYAKQVAIVSQEMQFPFDITVEEFVALGRIPHQGKLQFFETDHDLKIINNALKLTDVFSFRKRQLQTLSGGERQRVVIAKALAQEPKLLLLDEAIIFLDISHQVMILDLIRRLHKEKHLNVVIVLHELNLASEYCDRLILLHQGKVHSAGLPQEVLKKEIIEQVYQTKVIIQKHPLSKKPYVLIVPQEKE